MTGYTFSQLIDFTRTSAATYVNSAGNIVSTPASVNLLTFTNEFANAAWTKIRSSVTANTVTAPDGTLTADALVEDTTASTTHVVRQNSTLASGSHTFSVYAKAGTRSFIRIINASYGQAAYFNLTNGTVGAVDGGSTVPAITALPNGWYRCSITWTATAGVNSLDVRLATGATGGSESYTGDGTSGVYLWGAQLELGSTATTYVRNFGGLFPARFDYDPVTLAPRGLLVEEQRTNLITYSEQIDNAAWTKNAATVTANAATSPDGTTNADKIVPNTTNTVHGAYRTQTYGAGTFTFSFYAKADGYPRVGVRSYDGTSYFMQVTFDVSAGTVVSATAGTASIQAAGNGWYRCVVTATTAGNMGATVGTWIEPLPAGQIVQASYAGDGTSGTLVYGGQLEAGAFATSYIPTTASQVTRAADVPVIQAPNFAPWYNQSEGTFVVDFDCSGTSSVLSADDGTNSNFIRVGRSSATGRLRVFTGGVEQADVLPANAAGWAGAVKLAAAYKANDFAASASGGTVGTDTSGTVPTAAQLRLGASGAGDPINGHIRSIRYYPTRLSNAQLQALSA